MNTFNRFAALGLVLMAVACGGGSSGGKAVLSPDQASGKTDRSGNMVAKAAAEGFNTAIDDFQAVEKSGGWNEGTCDRVAKKFLDASGEQESVAGKKLPEALYNAGLAYQRCGNDAKAKEQFEAAQAADSQFHRARAQIALYKFQQTGDLDSAIRELDQIIRDAKFQNVEGLVSLASLQMQRGGDTSGTGCANDLACAQLNLQRAMAIDDSFMPAFNQLALYYLEQAKASAAGKTKARGKRRGGLEVSGAQKGQVNSQQLDLAALVASQAQKKNPNYAPIHNTTGLILVELQNYNGAVKAFGKARSLDPKFFEAHMNYGAVSLSFRGYGEAEKAYREALKLRPDTYEAHLGLALALRGQISDSNSKQYVEEAQKSLDAAKKLEGNRPEAYYNEAILSQEYRAKTENPVPAWDNAIAQYQSFIAKAGSDDAFAAAVKRSKERVQDIEDTKKFYLEGKELEKQDKIEAEKRKAEEEAAKKAAAAAPPPAPGGAAPGAAAPAGAPGGAAPAGGAPPPAKPAK